jgi:hypothetical protein
MRELENNYQLAFMDLPEKEIYGRQKCELSHIDDPDITFQTEYELLGVYSEKNRIWSWSWGIAVKSIADNYLARKLIKYAVDLEQDRGYMKFLLTTARGIIQDTTQIDINLAVASYILKQPYIYEHKLNIGTDGVDNIIRYYMIMVEKDIIEEHVKKPDN